MNANIETGNVVAIPRVKIDRKAKLVKNVKGFLMMTVFLICLTGMAFVNQTIEDRFAFFIGLFSSITFLVFLLRMVLAFFYRPVAEEPSEGYKVSVVIPNFNENAESMMKTIECMLQQDYPVHEIIFVDDGSTDISGFEAIERMAKEHNRTLAEVAAAGNGLFGGTQIITHRFKKNKGKRHAQAWGFEYATGNMIFIIDSDGYIYPDAVRELLKPFKKDKVLAVTGHVNSRNVGESFMTRLQDLLYESAFRIGRGSQSVTNNVLVCSGAISMFRGNFVKRNLYDFLHQPMFGKDLMIGDDRRLTTLAHREGGHVLYQSTAKCITDVPGGFRKFFTQQVRWSKSFYIDGIMSLSFAWKRPIMLFWLLVDGMIWLIFPTTVIMSWVNSFHNIGYMLLIYSIGYLILSALSRNVFYIFKNPWMYLISPIFALVHMSILFPIRLYALATIHIGSWGTR